MRRLILVCVLALVVIACGEGDAPDQPTTTLAVETTTTVAAEPTTTTTVVAVDPCTGPLAEPGEYEGLNVVGDVEQPYWMVVPETYADIAPAPFYLHLASGDGDHDGFLAGWRPQLDDLDGLMAMVNTTAALSAEGSSPGILIALIEQISDDYCVDPDRIHVMGTSWSAQMADRFACGAADRIASFVTSGQGVHPDQCTPSRPVPLWTFTGDPDRAAVTRSLEKWIAINGCDPEPLVEDLGSGVFRKTYQGCEADIVFYDIEGMGHKWPLHEAVGPGAEHFAVYAEVDYLDEVLQFFADHPMR